MFHLQEKCLKLTAEDIASQTNFICFKCLVCNIPFNSLIEHNFQSALSNLNSNMTEKDEQRFNYLIYNPFDIDNTHQNKHLDQNKSLKNDLTVTITIIKEQKILNTIWRMTLLT